MRARAGLALLGSLLLVDPAGAQQTKTFDREGAKQLRIIEEHYSTILVRGQDPRPTRSAPGPAGRAFAAKVAALLGKSVTRVEAVGLPALKRLKAGVLVGDAEEAYFSHGSHPGQITVRRVRFKTALDAKAYFHAYLRKHNGAQLDPSDPRAVIRVAGRSASLLTVQRVVSACAGVARGKLLPKPLTVLKGWNEDFRDRYTLRFTVPPSMPAGKMTEVVLQGGLRLRRVVFPHVKAARTYFSDYVSETTHRRVLEMFGPEVVVVERVGLRAEEAGQALRAAWSSGAAVVASRAALAVFAPLRGKELAASLSVVVLDRGFPLYRETLTPMIDARRQGGTRYLKGDLRWKFVDGEVKNNLIYRTRGTLYLELLLTPGALYVIRTKKRSEHKQEKAYLVGLIKALGLKPPRRSKTTVPVR